MNPGTDVTSQGSTFFEDSHWHHGFFYNIILDKPEQNQAKDTDDKRCDDIGRCPGEDDSSGGKSEEERCSAADKDDDAKVIDSFEFLADRGRVGSKGKEEPDASGNDDDNGNVDVEDPVILEMRMISDSTISKWCFRQ